MPYSPMQLADSFIKTGELTDALDALNQQLAEQPTDDEARRLRVDVLSRLSAEYWQSALSDIAALTEKTDADFQRESVLHERLGQIDKAITAIEQARILNPQDERLTERLLNLLKSEQKYDEALALVRQQEKVWRWLQYEGDILVLMKNDVLATARYGLVLAQLDDLVGVLRADYLQAIKANVLLSRAHAYRRLEQTEIAREHYQSAQTLIPKDPTITFNLGLLDVLTNFDAALKQCREALANAPALLYAEMLNSIRDDATYQKLWEQLEQTSAP